MRRSIVLVLTAVLLSSTIVVGGGCVSAGAHQPVGAHDKFCGLVLETNSPLFQVQDLDGDEVLLLTDNPYVPEVDDISGKVALLGKVRRNYRITAEMKFLGHHLSMEDAGWFGFVARARDLENFELVWFMPEAEESATVAYVPVAHSIVPWWTEAYDCQQKGGPQLPSDDWFAAQLNVVGDEMSVFVNGEPVFTKKLTYYLSEGRPGFFVGTATDVAFRNVEIEDLPETAD